MGARKTSSTGTKRSAGKSAATADAAPDFEKAMGELEDVVRRLEAGDQPLEDALSAFEKGVGLVKALHLRLDAVQMRIDELTQGPDGAASLARIDDGRDEEDLEEDLDEDADDAGDDEP